MEAMIWKQEASLAAWENGLRRNPVLFGRKRWMNELSVVVRGFVSL